MRARAGVSVCLCVGVGVGVGVCSEAWHFGVSPARTPSADGEASAAQPRPRVRALIPEEGLRGRAGRWGEGANDAEERASRGGRGGGQARKGESDGPVPSVSAK